MRAGGPRPFMSQEQVPGKSDLSMCRKRPFATHGQRPRPARAAVCRIPCRILCLADVERNSMARRPVLTRRPGTLVRGCGQAYALQTVEPVTYRCGTRRVCQARSSGSERDTRARPHAVAPMNCVPEDSRRRSTCTGRTHSPRARADGNQKYSGPQSRPATSFFLIKPNGTTRRPVRPAVPADIS